MIKGTKHLLVYILLVIVVSALGWYLIGQRFKVETKTFTGVVVATTEQEISLRWLPVGTGMAAVTLKSDQMSKVRINSATIIIRESGPYKLRVAENSKKASSREDVKRERTTVSFDQFRKEAAKQPVYVKISAENGYNDKSNFTAKIIYYNTDNIAFSNY